MSLRLVTAPTSAAISLDEAKAHLRLDSLDDAQDAAAMDAQLADMIFSAGEMVEQATGRTLGTQEWELSLDAFPALFELPKPPVHSVTSITYIGADGSLQTLASSAYVLDVSNDFAPARIVPAYGVQWPQSRGDVGGVKVRFLTGYTDTPSSIKSWVKLAVGSMYEHREAEVVERGAVLHLGFADRLLDRYKVWSL